MENLSALIEAINTYSHPKPESKNVVWSDDTEVKLFGHNCKKHMFGTKTCLLPK